MGVSSPLVHLNQSLKEPAPIRKAMMPTIAPTTTTGSGSQAFQAHQHPDDDDQCHAQGGAHDLGTQSSNKPQ